VASVTPLRRLALVVYIAFLVTMILTVLPVSMLVRASLRPLIRRKLDAEVALLRGAVRLVHRAPGAVRLMRLIACDSP
ncbi:MAG: hypothetical protein MZW92_50680, partial [Comamonadaceae bacterium]|nr:hypothetical protein [Comamonadaceae bacterium]